MPVQPGVGALVTNHAESATFFGPLILTSSIFAASCPTWMKSNSYERSDSYLFRARRPRPWYDFECVLFWLKIPLFHIIQIQCHNSWVYRISKQTKNFSLVSFHHVSHLKNPIYMGYQHTKIHPRINHGVVKFLNWKLCLPIYTSKDSFVYLTPFTTSQ